MGRAKNPRLVLIAHLQGMSRRVRATIGLWRPDGGMAKRAACGGQTYLENNPQAWAQVADLGAQMVVDGAWLVRYALEQQRLAEQRQEEGS